MNQQPNMTDYEKEYREFSLSVPERFSFPIDVFDKWGDRLALFWTDGIIEKKLTLKGEWYLTGDRAYKDNDGYFWFVARADDIILTSGYRIGPFEIESVLIELLL